MPHTPAEALARCASAQLSFKERVAYNETTKLIDEFLESKWQGHSCHIKTSAIPMNVAGAVIRSYVEAGWNLQVQAVDGKTMKAAELIGRGLDCELVFTLTPRWEVLPASERSSPLASIQ